MVYVKLMRQMKKSVKLYKPGLKVEGAMMKYCPTLRRGEEMLLQQVKCFLKFWDTGIHKKLCFFFISRAP